jgi:hypothetical protein
VIFEELNSGFIVNYSFYNLLNILWEMLTGAPGALVKDMKKEII